ncbi:MAG: hypothetical protein H0T51_04155 [Pirellulales bacterium]|nr:hypothetical protein [Pirellulales bacterium]
MLALLLLDVGVAVALFAAGAMVHSVVEWQSWFVPVSMLPSVFWLWWRGAFPQATPRLILLTTATLSLYVAVKDAIWRDQPLWSFAVDVPIILLLFYATQPLCARFGLSKRCS